MESVHRLWLLSSLFICLCTVVQCEDIIHYCDESCGPQVSKCMLLDACNCTISFPPTSDCSCCKNCTQCLGTMYADCCACVGLCTSSPASSIHRTSEVEDFDLPIDTENVFEEHFAMLTDAGWSSHVFPVSEELLIKDDSPFDSTTTSNCTTVYLDECMSAHKCRSHCRVLSASRMRWFHTGCCECVGGDCIAYGSREQRCSRCKRDEL